MIVSYVKNGLLSEGLEFNNPNVRSNCGCGESVAFEETA
jgi:Fe-S cluster assembly iron-binding protein IscA